MPTGLVGAWIIQPSDNKAIGVNTNISIKLEKPINSSYREKKRKKQKPLAIGCHCAG
jgi:hypothetical protein